MHRSFALLRMTLHNSVHVISPVPHAVVAGGLAWWIDFLGIRARAHRFFARTSPDPPRGGIDRRPLARFAALHGHRFRNCFSDSVHALWLDDRRERATAGSEAPSDRADAAADGNLAVRHFSEDARPSRRGGRDR